MNTNGDAEHRDREKTLPEALDELSKSIGCLMALCYSLALWVLLIVVAILLYEIT